MKRVWMITSASRDPGSQIAKAVLANGDSVVATARSKESIKLSEDQDDLLALSMDVTDEQQVKAVVTQAKERFGRIDVLVNKLLRRCRKTIILGGVATNFCAEPTARAAFDRGYEIFFAEDAMSGVSADAHTFSVSSMFPRIGRVRTVDRLLAESA
jgi:NAD(P)-dependent dehydrogenase (short-subunit alcohol dehydrogenase family)